VRETETLVEQQPPQGVFVCDHAGLVVNEFSLTGDVQRAPRTPKTTKPEASSSSLLLSSLELSDTQVYEP